MINPSEVVRIPDNEWWRMNPKKGYTYSIEWTPKKGGWVRSRLDSIDVWHYVECRHCQLAEGLGLKMVVEQEQLRERGVRDYNYQGA